MIRNAALVAQKEKRIQELEVKKLQIEETIRLAEVNLEDLNNELVSNNKQLLNLLKQDNLYNEEKSKLGSLIWQSVLVIISFVGLSLTINFAFLIFLIAYGIYCAPKLIRILKNIQQYISLNLDETIKLLRENIQDLEKDKEELIKVIRKLNYSIDNVEVEKKVMQDILSFISEREKDSLDSELFSEKVDLNRTRINPCM